MHRLGMGFRVAGLALSFVLAAAGCDSESEDELENQNDRDADLTEGDAATTEGDAATADIDASSAASACEGATKEEVCGAFCEALCANQELHCNTSECAADDCAPDGAVMQPCLDNCDDVECARTLCMEQQETACESFGIEADGTFETLCFEFDPICVQAQELGCSDVCGVDEGLGGQLVDNGICEDGHADSMSNACSRGTDCTDCGPHACVPAGETCSNHGDCCGFYTTGALCLSQDSIEDPFCVITCDDDAPCPAGFVCKPTSNDVNSVCVREE